MNQLTAGLIVVIGILGGFYVGAKYGQGHPTPSAATATTTGTGTGGTGTFAGAGGGGNGGSGFAGGGAGAGAGTLANATIGQITAVNGDTITVHDTRNNRDVKINVSSARISKTTDGTPADLTQNQTVTVVGQAGSDGTVTATVISIGNGTNAFGGGGRRGGATASPSPGT